MEYQIMQQDGGRKFIPATNVLNNEPMIYDNAKKAAEVAKVLSEITGIKHQPRPVKAKEDWRDRERKRFETGEYTPVLWVKQKWWKDIPDHFAHVAVKDKTRIAYTPDAEKGEADRQTSTTPGKYLKQFFGDVLPEWQIRDFAMEHANKYEDIELCFANTPEEIQEAYKPYVGGSCFSGTTNANLYGSGDFAVAYIKRGGKITGRTICVPERKVYTRCYGDECRLQALLEKAGYRLSTAGKDYDGLRLLKKWWWNQFYADFNGFRIVDHPDDTKFKIVQAW